MKELTTNKECPNCDYKALDTVREGVLMWAFKCQKCKNIWVFNKSANCKDWFYKKTREEKYNND